jgi:hypothetical protein
MSEKKDEADATTPKAAAKAKDTKAILQNVVFHDKTFRPGDEEELEQRLTKERGDLLLGGDSPALSGDWHFKGKADDGPPMAGSRILRDKANEDARAAAAAKEHPGLSSENAELRKKIAKLEAELESKAKAEASAVHAASAGKAHAK